MFRSFRSKCNSRVRKILFEFLYHIFFTFNFCLKVFYSWLLLSSFSCDLEIKASYFPCILLVNELVAQSQFVTSLIKDYLNFEGLVYVQLFWRCSTVSFFKITCEVFPVLFFSSCSPSFKSWKDCWRYSLALIVLPPWSINLKVKSLTTYMKSGK